MQRLRRMSTHRLDNRDHQCQVCGEWETAGTQAPLLTGEVVCWKCAEQAGEFTIPPEREWRHSRNRSRTKRTPGFSSENPGVAFDC
jgi:transcription initiation factor TFIIIB Brf1 subunit/transcription initiation factor TFIIB